MLHGRSCLKRLWCGVLALGFLACAQAGSLEQSLLQALDQTPHPTNAAQFQTVRHLSCQNQGKTLVCWSFATSSFVESEMARLRREPVRLSVMYTVYCQYLEKARRFVQTKGESRVGPGDVFCGGLEVFRQYGAMPASVYDKEADWSGAGPHQMYAELDGLVAEVKQRRDWNEAHVLSRAKKILNRYLGEPPKTFPFNGRTCTAKSFLEEVVRLPWDEYLMVTSFESAPFNTFMELKVPDNWRHNTNFFNVPLPVFYQSFLGALKAGYSAAVSVDNSEPSYDITGRYCLVPDFDLPAGQITQAARELRFLDGATSDDHAIHFIGCGTFGGEEWFLAKDSWKVAWRDGNKGDLFLHSSYVKLKVLAFVVHRDGVPQIDASGGAAPQSHW
jgi:bleomycin hydrolase